MLVLLSIYLIILLSGRAHIVVPIYNNDNITTNFSSQGTYDSEKAKVT